MAKDRGLTLIELIALMALIALGMGVGLPWLTAQSLAWETRQVTGELSNILRQARAEAQARNNRVTLCRSHDGEHCPWDSQAASNPQGWEYGWILFVENSAGVREILQIRRYPHPRIRITGNAPVQDYVSFTGIGAARRRHGGLQIGTLTACANERGQAIVLSRSGRMRLEPATCNP